MSKIKIINDPADKYIDEYYNFALKKCFINPWISIFYFLSFIFISIGIEEKVIGNFLLVIIIFFIYSLMNYVSIHQKSKKSKKLLKDSIHYYEIDEEKIIIKDQKNNKSKLDYNLISKLIETENLFVIQYKNNTSAYLLSKDKMKKKDITEFIKIMNITLPKKHIKIK